jgi:DNA-binding NtrC family response regulator
VLPPPRTLPFCPPPIYNAPQAMNLKPRILLVDDDTTALDLMSEILSEKEYEVDTSSSVDEAVRNLKSQHYHALITDLKMPEKSGIELLEYVVGTYPDTPVIMLTAYGTIQTAVEALKKGAFDYIAKPVQLEELSLTLSKAISHVRLRAQNIFLRHELHRRDEFLYGTKNEGMARIYDTIESVKSVQSTVLLQGESGTGKEVIARYIHDQSPRAAGSFVPINCGAIPENLIESELFGYEKGAFTDAKVRTKGKLEIADGGTLFMDEINELPAKAQVALLRFLQDPEITPLGSTRRIALNVRILVATNKDLKQLVRDGRFREDLYYRVNVLPITLPPLRERREDIIDMADWFLQRFCQEYNRRISGFTKEAQKRLICYAWPGNIRELRNCIERAVIICRNPRIGSESLYLDTEAGNPSDFSEIGIVSLKQLERRYIHWVLDRLGGNRTTTASRLGISVRGLRYKLNSEEHSD